MDNVTMGIIWTVVTSVLLGGISYGSLYMTARSNAARIEAVKEAHDGELRILREALVQLTEVHTAHKVETADRLARIETKIDEILRSKH